MLATLVAIMCHIGTPYCVEEIVAQEVPRMQCMVMGQAGIMQWMEHHPKFSSGWRVDSYMCERADYEPKDRI